MSPSDVARRTLVVSSPTRRPSTTRRAPVALAILAALSTAAWGCSSEENGGSEATDIARASLHRAKSCPDLLSDLKADAALKVKRSVNAQIAQIRQCIAQTNDASSCAYVAAYGGARGVGGSFAEDDAAPSAPSGSANEGGGKASSYSETNTQVKGVDEADIVKTDGSNIYVLHGSAFKIVKAWPATELADIATLPIEGTPSEMFVDGDKAVVYSTVNGSALYAAAGVTPKEIYQEYGYATADVARPATDVPGGGAPPSSGSYVPLTKITVLTLTGNVPAVARELYFEGNYLDSRRVDDHVRTVLSGYAHGPRLLYSVYELIGPTESPDAYPQTGKEMITALERLREANLQRIEQSQLGDWIPNSFTKEGGAVTARTVACEDFYVPNAGSTEAGITEVASIDLAHPAALPRETAILGRVDNVYGNAKKLYLAANAWVEPPAITYDYGSGGGTSGSGPGGAVTDPATPPDATPAPEPAPVPEEPIDGGSSEPAPEFRNVKPLAGEGTPGAVVAYTMTKTHVHAFEFDTDATFANYVASGSVPGAVKNQFSLDEKDGQLRVATTENRLYTTADGRWVQPSSETGKPDIANPQTVSHLYVLGLQNGWLETIGDVGALAPNETIQSVRFVGTRGYVVTFRQVDPLFVIDLAQPTAPTVLAALKIPGFSEYMHPLDDTHLLTIGRDASSTGQQRGLQLQIFDVTDGRKPIQQHVFTYDGSEYGSSDAEWDHKAFTYFADKGLLAFPYYSYGQTSRSSLELFKIDLGAGITKLGSIDHTALVSEHPAGYCGGYYTPQVRRGLFMENVVYSISYGGVVAKDVADLAGVGAQLPLPAPTTDTQGGYAVPPCEKY